MNYNMKKIAQYQVSLKCFLKNKNWETLILKTPSWSSFNWMYDFPGWRIDENEFDIPYIDILKREVIEETYIKNIEIVDKVVAIWRHKVLASQRRKPKNWDNYLFYIFFEGSIKDEEKIEISCEHNEFKWVKLEEIKLEDYFCSWYLEGVKRYLGK